METAANDTQVRLTVAEAARLWNLSTARVKVLCDQGRVRHEKVGVGPSGGARLIFILQREKPERAAPGDLSPAQRQVKAERSGKAKKAAQKKPRRPRKSS